MAELPAQDGVPLQLELPRDHVPEQAPAMVRERA